MFAAAAAESAIDHDRSVRPTGLVITGSVFIFACLKMPVCETSENQRTGNAGDGLLILQQRIAAWYMLNCGAVFAHI